MEWHHLVWPNCACCDLAPRFRYHFFRKSNLYLSYVYNRYFLCLVRSIRLRNDVQHFVNFILN